MSGTDKTAAKNKDHIKIDNPQSGCALHQPKPMEYDRDDDRDEQLEEALDQRWMIQKRQVSAMV